MKTKKMGKLPVNSRVYIDYSSEKPKIRFGYPRKDANKQVSNSLPPLMISGIIMILIASICGFLVQNYYSGQDIATYYPVKCQGAVYSTTSGSNVTYPYKLSVNCIKRDGTVEAYNYTYSQDDLFGRMMDSVGFSREYQSKSIFQFPFWRDIYYQAFLPIFLVVFILFLWRWIAKHIVSPLIVNTKWGQKRFPEWNKMIGDKHYSARFTKVPRSKTIEIPLFRNIYLDYISKKDFARCLERVEIIEHPFSKVTKKRGKKIREKNIYLWKATFYFKEIPKDGFLEVRWT